jgi:beta-lactamase class D
MTADTRGFRYTLAAARRRADYTLDAAINELQNADAALRQARGVHSDIESRRQALLAHARAGAQRTLVPAQRIVLADRLAGFERELVRQSAEVARHERKHQDAMAIVARRKAELEAFDRDRDTCLKAFVALKGRQEQARLDQDWVARRTVEACQ